MGFIALILALLIEEFRPPFRDSVVHRSVRRLADRVAAGTNAGGSRHGIAGWLITVGLAIVAVVLAEWLLAQIAFVLVLALHVLVLHYTVGFRQFSHALGDIHLALAANDPEGARQSLQRWIREDHPGYTAGNLSVSEICRSAIAHALVVAHRNLFGPLFWYIVLPGAVGPVIYRVAQILSEHWRGARLDAPVIDPDLQPTVVDGEPYGDFAARAYEVIDWIPVRLAAFGFAIVGNFEDAAYCWRGATAVRGGDEQRRILLMTGSGALGLRIADPLVEAEVRGAPGSETDPSLTTGPAPNGFEWSGAEPSTPNLRSSGALIFRSAVLWILLFGMVTIANWLGR
jgi:adenosylcobinamide-phosphate synthase